MPVRLNGSTSGYSELSAPAVAGNNTITLPTGNGTAGQHLQGDGAGGLSWGVGVSSDSQLCKAWVNFNGTGTVAIRASYNVSSITDNGVGDYTVNFTTALTDANYSANVSVTSNGSVNSSTNAVCVFAQSASTTATPTASGFRMFVYHPGNQVAQDVSFVTAAIFR
jgi:hypothetical protein